MHYFELFGLSIAMYIKLKEEFRTVEFIQKYLSKIMITQQFSFEKYSMNNFLFTEVKTSKLNPKKLEAVKMVDAEEEKRVDVDDRTVRRERNHIDRLSQSVLTQRQL